MNELTVREPRAQVVAGGGVGALVPQTLDEAFRVATAISKSGLAPQGLQTPEKVLVAIMAGAELGMAPFQSLQSFAVVNGKPTLWGDGLLAVARAQGVRVKEWFEGEGDALVARCEVTRPDTGETTPGEFSVKDAKDARLWDKSGPWQQYPKRMLKMRARAYALRDGCADMLRGFQVREEVEDHEARDVTPPKSGLLARLSGGGERGGFSAEHVEAETAEFTPAESISLADRAAGLETSIRHAMTADELGEAWGWAEELRAELDAKDPDRLADLEALRIAREVELGA
jgi:hypothetical protein